MTEPRTSLRQLYRQYRQGLSHDEHDVASTKIKQQLLQLDAINQAKKIAVYLSNDGEVDLTLFVKDCWQRDIELYLPVLHPFIKGYLLFTQYRQDYSLKLNKYGIAEPELAVSHVCPVINLDVILTPLVAFDKQGNRLGMGGGYYDRTLSHCTQHSVGPVLMGIAHDGQQAAALPAQSWDIPMNLIVTPNQIITPN